MGFVNGVVSRRSPDLWTRQLKFVELGRTRCIQQIPITSKCFLGICEQLVLELEATGCLQTIVKHLLATRKSLSFGENIYQQCVNP